MSYTSIGEALFTKTQQRVLGLLYGRPDKSFYTNEVVRRANMGRGTVVRELGKLASAGLLVSRREGNQLHFQANAECPIYHELVGIVKKSFGVSDVIREALAPLSKNIELAFIYGSVASGEERQGSDIDMMIVGALSFEAAVGAVYPCQEILEREINPNLFTREEFVQKMNEENSFIAQALEKPKLMILGKEDDIRKSGKNQ